MVNETYKEGIEPNATYIKKLYLETKQKESVKQEEETVQEEKKLTLFEFIEQYTEEAKAILKKRTIQSYKTFYRLLQDYGKKRKKEIDFHSIDLTFYYDFIKFMYSKPYLYSINTADGKIKILKKFLNEATERGINENLTFRSNK